MSSVLTSMHFLLVSPFRWDVGPELFQLGPLSIRWYGLLFATAFFLGFLYMRYVFVREHKKVESLDSLLFYMMISTIVGARLGHCLFYDPGYYLSNPIEILKVWRGGLASHGGAIGILTGMYFYSRKQRKQPYLWLLDRVVVPIALAGSLIRLGNLFNSEILGIPTEKPWAIIFARVDEFARHPAQLYESISYLIIFGCLHFIYKRLGDRTPNGLLLGLFLVLVFSARFFIEFVKVRQAAFSDVLPLSMGQLLSIPAVIAGVILLIRALNKMKSS
ncbi:MAG: prolipoprotein diacylglyceryl transferase [Rhodothermales bacterium]